MSEASQFPPRARWPLALVACLTLLALLRLFVFGVYSVEGRSMEPTLGPEESVLVRYGRGEVERFALVVLQRPEAKEPKVKRVVGLPGESVQIVRGDLVINGERLPLSEHRPPLVDVFNDSNDAVEEWFQMGGTQVNPWKKTDEGWRLAAEEVPAGAAAGTMFFSKRLTAGHISGNSEAGPGGDSVADSLVACEVRAGESAAELYLSLREQGDTFWAKLTPELGGEWSVRLSQRWRGGEELLLAEGSLPITEGWASLRFGNVDDHLFLQVMPEDGTSGLTLSAGPLTNHLDPSDREGAGETYGHRVGIGGAAGVAEFRHIRISRDLHYTERGTYGTTAPVHLGPAEYFVLGDNPPESRDGRDWGPVSAADLIGRPGCVVWPPPSVRALGSDARGLLLDTERPR